MIISLVVAAATNNAIGKEGQMPWHLPNDMKHFKRIYMTRVEATPDADTFFPVIEGKQWQLISQRNHEADEKNPFNYSFQQWERLG